MTHISGELGPSRNGSLHVSTPPRSLHNNNHHVTERNSRPTFSCFATGAEEGIFSANSPLERATEWRNLSDPTDLTTWMEEFQRIQSWSEVYAELCFRRSETIMKHMGTPNVARDLDVLYRTLEGDDTLVNYWGFSYGTILGAYFVNM